MCSEILRRRGEVKVAFRVVKLLENTVTTRNTGFRSTETRGAAGAADEAETQSLTLKSTQSGPLLLDRTDSLDTWTLSLALSHSN